MRKITMPQRRGRPEADGQLTSSAADPAPGPASVLGAPPSRRRRTSVAGRAAERLRVALMSGQ